MRCMMHLSFYCVEEQLDFISYASVVDFCSNIVHSLYTIVDHYYAF